MGKITREIMCEITPLIGNAYKHKRRMSLFYGLIEHKKMFYERSLKEWK